MKRILVTFILAIVAGTTIAATVQHLIAKDEVRFGGRSVSFELDGVDYVITDKATLDEIEKVTRPQVELGMKQAQLGVAQAKLGAKQADTDDENKQRELKDAQLELASQQQALGERQLVAGAHAEKELEKIFRNAVRSGVARRR